MKKITLLLISFFAISAMAQVNNGIAKGTIVTLADGTEISIEEVRKGDSLLTLKSDMSSIVVSKVVDIETTSSDKSMTATLANGASLTLTPNQVLLGEKGWSSVDNTAAQLLTNYQNISVGKYGVDSFIYTFNTNAKIEILPIIELEETLDDTTLYRLKLDTPAAFIANGIFVGQ